MKASETRHIPIADSRSSETPAQEPEPLEGPRTPDPSSSGLGTRRISSPDGLGTRRMSPPPQAFERVEGRLPDGHLLQNRYRILGVLGVGGMSAVYKAQDLRFPKVTRLCVVKEMRNTATDPHMRALTRRNFEREANILATLSHPAIVQVFDYFSEADSSYLVLEYVEGKDLEALLSDLEGFLKALLNIGLLFTQNPEKLAFDAIEFRFYKAITCQLARLDCILDHGQAFFSFPPYSESFC